MAPSKGKAKETASSPPLKTANALKLRHILCEKSSKKNEALALLVAGSSFDSVATNYSEDKARHGGSLGWQSRNAMIGAFQEVCFDLAVSTCAKPVWVEIKSKFGYHIVIVEDRKI